MRVIFAAFAGAVLAYLMDPDRGRRRRIIARDRFMALVRRGWWRSSQMRRRAAGSAYGVFQEATHAPEIREALDDGTLARKVESEIFRGLDIPKGSINVNVEDGVVVLRGEVERSTVILEIEAAVRRIPDVLDVQNLLHRPGEVAPNKAQAMREERPPAPPSENPADEASATQQRPPAPTSENPAEGASATEELPLPTKRESDAEERPAA